MNKPTIQVARRVGQPFASGDWFCSVYRHPTKANSVLVNCKHAYRPIGLSAIDVHNDRLQAFDPQAHWDGR